MIRPEITQLLEQYQLLLSQVCANPDQPLTAYSLITASTEHFLPDPTIDLPLTNLQPVHERIRQVAQQHPAQTALKQATTSLNYAELIQRAEQIAFALIDGGLMPAEAVAIRGKRSIGLFVSMLATWMAGGVVVPIDDSLPALRQQAMLEQSQATTKIVVSGSPNAPTTQANQLHVHQQDGQLINCHPQQNPLPTVAATQAAYIFFTSGTTGTPKGIFWAGTMALAIS